MNTRDIRIKIENLYDKDRYATLKDLKAIKHIGIDYTDNIAVVAMEVVDKKSGNFQELKREMARLVKIELGFKGLKLLLCEVRPLNSCFNDSLQTIVITSSKPNTGKTTIACNLAYQLAQANKKTVLLNLDFKKDDILTLLKTKNIGYLNYENKIIPPAVNNFYYLNPEFLSGLLSIPLLNNEENVYRNIFTKVNFPFPVDYLIIDIDSETLMKLKNMIFSFKNMFFLLVKDDIKEINPWFVTRENTKGIILNKCLNNKLIVDLEDIEVICQIMKEDESFVPYKKDVNRRAILDLITIITL